MKKSLITVAFSFIVLTVVAFAAEDNSLVISCQSSSSVVITHGPILGRLSRDGIGVWVRTSKPTQFCVRYQPKSEQGAAFFAYGLLFSLRLSEPTGKLL